MPAAARAEQLLVTVRELARLTRVPEITLKREARAGRIPGQTKANRVWRIPYPLPPTYQAELLARTRPRRSAGEDSDKVHELGPYLQRSAQQRYIGVVDTGLVDQLDDARATIRYLQQQLAKALDALTRQRKD